MRRVFFPAFHGPVPARVSARHQRDNSIAFDLLRRQRPRCKETKDLIACGADDGRNGSNAAEGDTRETLSIR
ncbi:MAG: hypothetical protein JSW27_26265 [Phycisphaerales bacterium]|nr:MAG: hypothetical protein JSW27_26265 [Phycisphaerales bacterium]